MYTIDYILNKAKDNDYTEEELRNISKAYDFALKAHKDQKRLNGDDQITHSLTVAGIVADLNVDDITIIAALLHECIPLCDIALETLKKEFGDEVANLLDNHYKLTQLKVYANQEDSSQYIRKILVGLSSDVRVLILRLADRLHNMRTLDVLDDESRKRVSDETTEVLIPIAHRLGIYSIKSELEDLSIKHSKPDIYNEIVEKLAASKEKLSSGLEEMKNLIGEILNDHDINFQMKSRVKSVSSIYSKLSAGRQWSDIYDILAMRLIVQTEADCYLTIGLIHAKFRPIPKRFKDFIAMPKQNMYQSLHTAVFGIGGNIFEIQIRTPEMDLIAENGIASHWSYKEKGINTKNIFEQKLELFRNFIESNKDEASDEAFIKNIQEDILSDQIYVFTPKGDVMELPKGSTPIDFAYRVHSEVGDKTVGAIVNNNIVQLNYELNDGDIININTSKQAKPSKEWLKFAKTTQAKNKIKAYFSKKDREMYIERGKDLLEKEIRKQKLAISETLSEENINKVMKDLKLTSYEEVLLGIGSLRYTAIYIINLIKQDKRSITDIMLGRVNKDPRPERDYKNDIIVANMDSILVSIANCCNPLPGDEIIGYVTKRQGVSVHKTNCPNITSIDERLVSCQWNLKADGKTFNAKLHIVTNKTQNHILEIVSKASQSGVSIHSIKEIEAPMGFEYAIELKVKNRNDLITYVEEVKKLSYVQEVRD